MRVHKLAVIALAVAACGGEAATTVCPQVPGTPQPSTMTTAAAAPAQGPPTVDEARAFVDATEAKIREVWVRGAQADWINQTDLTDDTDALSASAAAETARVLGEAIVAARRFDAITAQLPPDVARKLHLLKLSLIHI